MKRLRSALRTSLSLGLTLATLAGCGMVSPARNLTYSATEVSRAKARMEASPTGLVPVVLYEKDPRKLGELVSAGLDVWGTDGTRVKGAVTREALARIEAMRLRIENLPETQNTFDKGYKTVAQMEADLRDLAARFPQLARLEDFGDSWLKRQGKDGHDLWVLKIGKGDLATKPAVIYLGNHHARELVTPEIVLNLAHLLLEQYGQDPEITSYVDNRAIYLVPTVNPDGHLLAEKGADQRKNVNNITGGKRRIGVDLNRNYGFKWGLPGASDAPEADTFRGTEAFSEPETQAVRDLVASRKFTFLMTYHSFSNLILWPWGHTADEPRDARLPAIGRKLATFNKYTPQQSKDLYFTSGDTTDWAFGTFGTLAYTTEVGSWGDNFDPPFSRMGKFWNENRPGALYLLKVADEPAAVFGPEVRSAQTRDGQLEVQVPAGVQRVEAFTGRVGQAGTGMTVQVQGQVARLALPPAALSGRQVLQVRALGQDGRWGAPVAVWSR